MAACSALEAEGFIASLPRPGDFDKSRDNVEQFVAYHAKEGNKLAFVTVSKNYVEYKFLQLLHNSFL